VKKKEFTKKDLPQLCKARKVLEKGNDLLNEKTWIKGEWVKRDRKTGAVRMCAIGALRVARKELGVKDDLLSARALKEVVKTKQTVYGSPFYTVPDFNDNIHTKLDDVKSAFSDAIQLLDDRIMGLED
jgi:hypothetical protein